MTSKQNKYTSLLVSQKFAVPRNINTPPPGPTLKEGHLNSEKEGGLKSQSPTKRV